MTAFTDHRAPIDIRETTRERLAAGVALYLAASFDHDYLTGPKWIQLDLAEDGLQRLLRLRALCLDGEIDHVVTRKVRPSRWDASSHEVTVNDWKSSVDDTDFWFHGTPKSGAGACLSSRLPLRNLEAVLGAGHWHVPDELDDQFRWFGGALVFDAEGVSGLVAELEGLQPELAARQREIDMAAAIQQHVAQAESQPAAAVARRRRAAV